ncbi:MAG: hypothetical protein P4L98_05655 [Ancalomicrobiaceae bacterium]|nr:hypothetical protein [Ancalomicrobiaceae bacterium]
MSRKFSKASYRPWLAERKEKQRADLLTLKAIYPAPVCASSLIIDSRGQIWSSPAAAAKQLGIAARVIARAATGLVRAADRRWFWTDWLTVDQDAAVEIGLRLEKAAARKGVGLR